VVDAEVVADSCQGPAEVVEVDGVVDLLGREAAAAHRYAVPVEDVADRPPFDAEPFTEFVHRRAGPVVGDQLLYLIGTELSSPARPVPLDQARLRSIEAEKLLAELFQCSDLVFYVRVRSPNLHSIGGPCPRRARVFCVELVSSGAPGGGLGPGPPPWLRWGGGSGKPYLRAVRDRRRQAWRCRGAFLLAEPRLSVNGRAVANCD
jgi:hypothetical protein